MNYIYCITVATIYIQMKFDCSITLFGKMHLTTLIRSTLLFPLIAQIYEHGSRQAILSTTLTRRKCPTSTSMLLKSLRLLSHYLAPKLLGSAGHIVEALMILTSFVMASRWWLWMVNLSLLTEDTKPAKKMKNFFITKSPRSWRAL